MAESRKILGQSRPAATTLVDVYTVPANKQAVVSTITAANRGGTTTIRISAAPAGAVDADGQYLYFDLPLPGGGETFATTIGITLDETDVLRVYSNSGDVDFNVFGVEIDV